MPRILIRVDIGGVHGLGHGVRMRVLAQALAAQGAEVAFVTQTPALAAFVAPSQCWIGEHACRAYSVRDGVHIVDTAADIPASDYFSWRAMDSKIVVFDKILGLDLVDLVDLVILPNAHTALTTIVRLEADFPGRVLHGWDYVMLPEDVTEGAPLPYTEREQQIVLCAGGSDPDGMLQQMYNWTTDLEIDAELCFLIGSHAAYDRLMIKRVYRKNVPLVASFTRAHLAEASLVVTTFGQVVYEALYYQTPCVVLARNEDDDRNAFWLQRHCAAVYAADIRTHANRSKQFCRVIQMAWTLRRPSAASAVEKLDGHGVERVADAILALVR